MPGLLGDCVNGWGGQRLPESPSWLSLKHTLFLGPVPTFWFGITCLLVHLMAISHSSSLKHPGRGRDQGRESSPYPNLFHYSGRLPSPGSLPRFICQSSIFWHPLYAWVAGAHVKDTMESKTRGLIFRALSLMGRNSLKLISSSLFLVKGINSQATLPGFKSSQGTFLPVRCGHVSCKLRPSSWCLWLVPVYGCSM